MWSAALAGFALGGGLIVAIGAQNAFVIRQGILNQHIFAVALFCSLSDAILIWAGVYGLGIIIKAIPALVTIMTYGGAAFLIVYGCFALQRAMKPSTLATTEGVSVSLTSAIATCAAFTFLNPHVYLDTVILVGSIANARPQGEQAAFALGATIASFAWFFTLGFGAKFLRQYLAKPTVWRFIDFAIAAIMFWLAFKLLYPMLMR